MLKRVTQKILYILPIFGILALLCVILYGYSSGIFKSVQSLQTFIAQFKGYAVFFFILLQMVQVIIPILPGGISSAAGMLMFGNLEGLAYSYIGLIIGEIITYWLTRRYGKAFARLILSKKRYRHFERMLSKPEKDIQKLLIITLLIPFAPDDIACLVAGLAELPFKKYLQTLLIFKFWSIATYSYLLLFVSKIFIR